MSKNKHTVWAIITFLIVFLGGIFSVIVFTNAFFADNNNPELYCFVSNIYIAAVISVCTYIKKK